MDLKLGGHEKVLEDATTNPNLARSTVIEVELLEPSVTSPSAISITTLVNTHFMEAGYTELKIK